MKTTLLKALRKLALLGVLFLSASQVRAQLSGTKTIPTDYPSIAAFVTDLNTQGVGVGGVILSVPAGHTETAPAGGFQITATGTLADPIAIMGAGLPKPVITANPALTAGALNDGIFVLAGSDYVTLDNLDLQENAANTTTTPGSNNMTEWGVALGYASATNGAQHNTISNCNITLNKTYTNTWGIYSNTRHALTAPTVAADISATTGSNSFNKVYGNTISNVNMGIAFIGSNTAANMDSGNDIGGVSAMTGNTITNWGGAAAASGYIANTGTSYCIFMNHQTGDNVSFNTITSAAVSGTSVTFRGIFKTYSTTAPTGTFTSTIGNNTITMTSGFTSGTFECISSTAMGTLSTASVTINNNTLLNCSITGASASSTFVGIVNSSAPGTLSISNNVIQGTTSTATTGGFTGISNTGGVTGSTNMSNNQIGNGTGGAISFSAVTSGAVTGISNSGGTSTCALSMSSNNIQGIVHSGTTSSSAHNYIINSSATLSQNINSNTFTNLNVATSGNVQFIANNVALPTGGSANINGNSIVTAFNKSVAGGTVFIYFTSTSPSSVLSTPKSQQNNNFSNITLTGATTMSGWADLEGASGGGSIKTISNNTFSNWACGSNAVTVIQTNYSGNGTSVSSNTISNITGTGAITAISIGSSNGSGTHSYSNNTITGLVSSGTGGSVIGITGGSTTTTTMNLAGNTISSLSSTGASSSVLGITLTTGPATTNITGNTVSALSASGNTAPVVRGISVSAGTTVNVFANKVHTLSISAAFTAAAGTVSGVLLSGGTTVNTYNNVIGNLTASAASGTEVIRGIAVTSASTATYRVYYNTIYLNASSTGTDFGTSGLFHAANATAGTATLDLRNNIVINESVAAGTGTTVTYRRSGTALNNYATTSNRNMFYAGTPSATNLIFTDGTTPQQTFSGYQGVVATRDANSFTGEAFTYGSAGSFFVSLTGSSTDYLRPVAGITTQVESSAQQITTPAITTAYDGVIRAGNGGYTGTGISPDLGAYEFEGVTPAPVVTLNTVTPPTSTQCTSTARVVSVNVSTLSGTISTVVLNYTFNGVAQTPVTMTNISGTTWEGTIPVATPANASVTWNVVATSSVPLNTTMNGSAYADEPLFGFTGSVSSTAGVLCVGDATSLTANLVNSAAAPSYTLPPAVTNPTVDEDLANITITKGSTTILNNTAPINSLAGTIGTATGTAGSYSNYTAFGPYSLQIGDVYNFSISSYQQVTAYNNSLAIYIDYNRNGVFTDPGEQAFTSPVLISGAHTETGTFTVPASASPGLTRMRLISTETNLITSPTQAVSWGEYEEYTINLLPVMTSVTWSDGMGTIGTGNTISVSPSATTTYTASITSAGCTFAPSPTTTVTVNPLPTAPTATNSVQCGTQIPSASVTSTTGAVTPTFKWYDAPTAGTMLQSGTSTTFTSTISSTTTFYVAEVNSVSGCESPRTPVTVTVSAADGISAAVDFATVCIGSTVELTASNTNPTPNQTYTYTWSGTAGSGAETPVAGTVVNITPTVPGTYTYDLAAVDGSCNAVASISVTVDPFVATLTAINATCNGVANGSFSLNTSACGTMPYTYSVNGSAFGAIPTNLAAGSHSVIVQDDNGFQTTSIGLTVTEPATIVLTPTVSADVEICQDDLSASFTGTSFMSIPASGTVVIPFDLLAQPTELSATSVPTVSGSPNVISTATMAALPAGSVITSATLVYNGITAIGSSWRSDVRFGFSDAVTSPYTGGVGALNSSGVFDYTAPVAPAGINTAGGTISLHYFDFYSDNTGAEATFPTGTGVATLTINYTTPIPTTVTWWDAPTGGTQLGTGSPFESVGTSVLPNTSTTGTYTMYAGAEYAGCVSPSRIPVNVTVNAPTSSTIVATDCDSYTLNGTTYTATGIYTQNVMNVAGCDSTITLDLTIFGPTSSTTSMSACGSFMWTDGNTYTASGTYTQSLTNVNGCDSTATLNLTINDNASTTTVSNCGAYTWTDGNSYGTSGTYTQNLTNVFGCDSIATLNLTIANPTAATIVDAACDSYTLNGQTYTSTGIYVQNLTNMAGCDSTLTLDLTITNSSSSNTTIAECDAYTWTDGITYTSTGVYTQTLTSMTGCDSVATLTLTINTTPVATATDNGDATITASAGASYQWINCVTSSPLSGETSQTLNVISNGTYAVVISNGSCDDTSACVPITYIGLEENDAAGKVVIYPNPTRDNVTVQFNAATAYVEVYDAQGKLLETMIIESGSQVSLSDYDRGVYYLKVRSDKETSTHRVVKN